MSNLQEHYDEDIDLAIRAMRPRLQTANRITAGEIRRARGDYVDRWWRRAKPSAAQGVCRGDAMIGETVFDLAFIVSCVGALAFLIYCRCGLTTMISLLLKLVVVLVYALTLPVVCLAVMSIKIYEISAYQFAVLAETIKRLRDA